jgi:hypothetical protein
MRLIGFYYPINSFKCFDKIKFETEAINTVLRLNGFLCESNDKKEKKKIEYRYFFFLFSKGS